jgi:hypothetical protein
LDLHGDDMSRSEVASILFGSDTASIRGRHVGQDEGSIRSALDAYLTDDEPAQNETPGSIDSPRSTSSAVGSFVNVPLYHQLPSSKTSDIPDELLRRRAHRRGGSTSSYGSMLSPFGHAKSDEVVVGWTSRAETIPEHPVPDGEYILS